MTSEYPEWEETLAAIASGEGTVVLLGGTDVGKTTFARLLVNRLAESGAPCALLDADVGQSEIGPPACVGLALVESPVASLCDLTPRALAFVGHTSPQRHLPEHIAAVRRLADLAAPYRLIVDTSGYLHGPGARRLNQLELDLLAPAHIVGLQRQNELNAILAPMRWREGCAIHTPALPAVLSKKPPAFRAQRRAMKFAAYFQNAAMHTYSFDEAALVGTWLAGSAPLASHIHTYLSTAFGAHIKVFHAEMHDRTLCLMTSQPLPPQSSELAQALSALKASSVLVTVAPRLKHLLLGLEGANGKLLGLGLLEALDFRRRTLGVLTPVRAPLAARILRFGSLRLYPDGREIDSLKPGEL
jgi:polynucleotide 5'-hydroxyl-kinase GRC3/NOL9